MLFWLAIGNVFAQPHSEFDLSAPVGCLNDELSFTDLSTGAITEWLWDFGDGVTSAEMEPTHVFTASGTFTIILTVTDGDGLTDSYSDTYVVRPPVADFAVSPTISCAVPSVLFFTDLSSFPDTWFWNFGDGSTSTLQNPVHVYTTAGNYEIKLTVTDTNFGCVDTLSRTVQISTVNAQIGGPIGEFGCGPLTVTFENESTNTGAGVLTDYLWDFGDGTSSTEFEPTHVYDEPGIYTVSLTATNSLGCTGTDINTNYVQVIGPDVNFGWDTTFAECPDLLVSFTDSTIFGAPIVAWDWTFGDGGTSSFQNPEHTYTDYGSFTVALTVSDIDGCSRTLTLADLILIEDTESPIFTDCPASVIEPLSASCNFELPEYAASIFSSDNCTEPLTLTQTPAVGSLITSDALITLQATDISGNTGECSFTVLLVDDLSPTIACPPNQNVSFDDDCAYTLLDYTALATADDNCLTPVVTQSPIAGTLITTTQTITLTATDTAGNSAICTFDVIPADATAPSITCPPSFTVNTDEGICAALVAYTTPVGTDNCAATTVQTAGLPSGSLFPVGTTITAYEVTDDVGLADACTFEITVIDNELPTITCPSAISAENDLGVCSAIVTVAAPVTADNCSVASSALTSGLESGSLFPIGITTNTYTVEDVNGNLASCTVEITVVDTELPTISCPANVTSCQATISFDQPLINDNCDGATVALTEGLSAGSIFEIGTTTNTYQVTDASGNSAACSFTVMRFEVPDVDAGADVTTNAGKPVQLNGSSTVPGNFSWSPVDGLTDPSVENPLASPQQTTLYTLTVTTPDGCESSADVEVAINQEIEINNFMSPNGDGKNDRWEIKGNYLLDNCRIAVYDSWGNPVFDQTGYANDWDGTKNGEPLPAGVFYYVVQCDGDEALTGSITLIR